MNKASTSTSCTKCIDFNIKLKKSESRISELENEVAALKAKNQKLHQILISHSVKVDENDSIEKCQMFDQSHNIREPIILSDQVDFMATEPIETTVQDNHPNPQEDSVSLVASVQPAAGVSSDVVPSKPVPCNLLTFDVPLFNQKIVSK